MSTTKPTPPTAAPAGSSWQLGDRFTLRVTGLPFEAVTSLRSTASRPWADEVLDGEQRLAQAGAALSDLLHEAVADNDNEADRRALLALRRQVFNGKRPKDPEAALRLAESAAGPAAGRALADWLAEHTRWERLYDGGPAVLQGDIAAARERLHVLADEPNLRKGLLLASPSLDSALDTYQRRASGEPGKRDRRTERSLVE